MKLIAALVACGLLLQAVHLSAADLPPEISWTMKDFVADGAGKVWGFGVPQDSQFKRGSGSGDVLAEFLPDIPQWRPHPCLVVPEHAEPKHLFTLADGSVACFWEDSSRTFLTRHHHGKDELWCTLEVLFRNPALQPLANGGLLVTGRSQNVAIIPADGTKVRLVALTDDVLVRPVNDHDYHAYAPVKAMEVGAGRVWVWTDTLQKQADFWHIEGIMEINGDSIVHVQALPFKPGALIGAMAAEDQKNVLAAEVGVGLWRIPLSGDKPSLMEAPPHALDYVGWMGFLKGHWHVVNMSDSAVSDLVAEARKKGDTSMRGIMIDEKGQLIKWQHALWRLEGNSCIPVLEDIDPYIDLSGHDPRPIVAHEKGILIGATTTEPWWIPDGKDSRPFKLDEADGYELSNLMGAISLGSRGFLIRDEYNVNLLPVPGKSPKPLTTDFGDVYSRTYLQQDVKNHIWAWRQENANLAEWDGEIWHMHPVALGERYRNTLEFAADSHNRGWLIPVDDAFTVVIDFASGECRTFRTMEQAVEEALASGDRISLRGFAAFDVIAHPGGQKAFISYRPQIVHVFRQGKWLRYANEQITSKGEVLNPQRRCFFDAVGRFCIPLGPASYALGSDGLWTAMERRAEDKDEPLPQSQNVRPEGCRMDNLASTAYDRHGIAWLTTRDGELWKWLGGKAVQIKDGNRSRLFKDGATLSEVLYDPKGNAFLCRDPRFRHAASYQMKAGPVRAIQPAVLEAIKGRNATVQLNPTAATLRRWRFDKAAWQWVGPLEVLKLEDLKPGPHELQIETFDDQLTPVVKTQDITFTIEFLTPDILAQQIKALGSSDVVIREAAAHELKMQKASILPSLKQALEQANGDPTLQWWLQAVMQEIERQAAKEPNK